MVRRSQVVDDGDHVVLALRALINLADLEGALEQRESFYDSVLTRHARHLQINARKVVHGHPNHRMPRCTHIMLVFSGAMRLKHM